ncbi:hypothetical protein DFH06DRAFT_453855 [Mycena polygramma]|nr:hypothetical protein DFH06DRAFT_453855 [Mycena polygramma]
MYSTFESDVPRGPATVYMHTRQKELAHPEPLTKVAKMPPQPTTAQTRLNNTMTCLTAAADTLGILADSVGTPFLRAISTTTQSLAQCTIKQNKDDCAQLMEQTHKLLDVIIGLHLKSDTSGELSPIVLKSLGKFTETLHKIHTFVDAQQHGNRVKNFFRQSEMQVLLKECKAGLQSNVYAFEVQTSNLMTDVRQMQQYAEARHQEVLEMIANMSNSDGASSVEPVYAGLHNSSNSISLLPSEPQIFRGRESELVDVLRVFSQGTPRIAILGAGGMGKTSLARIILHHPEITSRYNQHRYFVACDSATTKVEVAALIGSHLALKLRNDLARPVISHFSTAPPTLLILDNLETSWEAIESRAEIEEFLSLLADIIHLALIITMRGAERPAKVKWTRPFLSPLKPLALDAAREVVIDITDDGHDMAAIDRVLALTDNMPLAITLIAHLVDLEGCSNILASWEEKKTSLISEGCDRKSNLDLSISLSLSSPRVISTPQSQDLLSILSILPDGLSDVELLQSNLPFQDILGCKIALLRTSLAYIDEHKRLKVLVPIREFMQKMYPSVPNITQSLLHYFQQLLEIFTAYGIARSGFQTVDRISANYSNIQNLLLEGLKSPDTKNSIYGVCYLNNFGHLTGRGKTPLIDLIPKFLPQPCDHRVEVYFITELFNSRRQIPLSDPEALRIQALNSFNHFDDTDLMCKFYISLASYYVDFNNIPAAMEVWKTVLSLAISTGNIKKQCQVLHYLAFTKWHIGAYSEAQVHAHESQRLASMSGNLFAEANAIRIENMCCIALGDYNQGVLLCNRAEDLLRFCGSQVQIGIP